MAIDKSRHYVIVVHGIGQQKLNETALEVAHRFAEVRQKKPAGYYKNLLPSYLSAQSVRRGGMGHGWSEFNGIPVDPSGNTGEFDGSPATDTSGMNFRFVDLHWAHILQRHQERYASPVEKWATALLERIDEKKGVVPEGWIPPWATSLLHSLVDTALPVKRLLAFRYPELAKLIFTDFLGDVHLYGDYARTRGRAVRHFHVILDEIHLRDFIDWCHHDQARGRHTTYEPPVYTIIAHSLGSIMSFDALVYAHAKADVRRMKGSADHPCPSLPFQGYTFDREAERESWAYLIEQLKETKRVQELKSMYPQLSDSPPEIPFLMWRSHVRSFVTLGSPIDKYHVMWFQNYLHMGLKTKDGRTPEKFKTEWADGWLEADNKIVHYNLCDEQDPVGHHLDVAQATMNYGRMFDTRIPVAYRDVVFRRYAIPGYAHIRYWDDGDLFTGIVNEVIDSGNQSNFQRGYFLESKFREGDGSVYKKALVWAYFRIPLGAALLTGLLVAYALFGGVAIYRLGALLAAVLLWTCPRPMEAYAEEGRPEKKEKPTFWRRWKLKRSILAHLVMGVVEWRRVLTLLSEGKSSHKETCLARGLRVAFKEEGKSGSEFFDNARWRYGVAIAVLAGSAVVALYDFSNLVSEATDTLNVSLPYVGAIDSVDLGKRLLAVFQKTARVVLVFSAVYVGTMIYALYVFLRARGSARRFD